MCVCKVINCYYYYNSTALWHSQAEKKPLCKALFVVPVFPLRWLTRCCPSSKSWHCARCSACFFQHIKWVFKILVSVVSFQTWERLPPSPTFVHRHFSVAVISCIGEEGNVGKQWLLDGERLVGEDDVWAASLKIDGRKANSDDGG